MKRLLRPRNLGLLVVAHLWFLLPILYPSGYVVSTAVLLGIYAIIALGYNIVMGNTGIYSFGHAAFFGVGGYTVAILTVNHGLNPWLAFAAAPFLAALAGLVVGLTSIRLSHFHLAMATIAFNVILTNLNFNWSGLFGSESGIGPMGKLSLGGIRLDTDLRYFYLTWVFVAVVLWLTHNFVRSHLGRAMAAVREDEVAASTSGINVVGVKLMSFVVSAFLAGVAGALLGFYMPYVGPRPFTVSLSIMLFVMVCIGGRGSAWGSLLGAALLTVLPEFLRTVAGLSAIPHEMRIVLSNPSYHLVMYGIILIVFLVYLPQGLVGIRLRRRRRPGLVGQPVVAVEAVENRG